MTLDALIAAERLPADYSEVVERHWAPLADAIVTKMRRRPWVVGINGAQGSGKTTVCRFLEDLLLERGHRTVTLALDDLYLRQAEREELAQRVHPLFVTRGVPGTHDTQLGLKLLAALKTPHTRTPVQHFDKANDDRTGFWSVHSGTFDVILFEGWCVGAVPQPAAALRRPANALEAEEDSDGRWRREVNRRLATDYAQLFARIDWLVMLKVDNWDAVRANRLKQERKLGIGSAVMDEIALDRFLMHYERLTRWQLAEMPERADRVIEIGEDQRPL